MLTNKIKVLYIDDEPVNLEVFKAGFRFDYEVITATSALEGIEILKNQNVQVIIADQRMPKMTGVEFFESVLKDFPEPVRILITGYADIEAVIAAINSGQVYRYIKKPWDNQEIKLTIENAYETYMAKKELKEANAKLTKTNEELNRFVYSASHDLKAPIMSVMGLLKVAELEGENKNPEKYFGMIKSSVKQLDIFIHNIINYYKNIRMEEAMHEIDFKKIVQETLDSYNFIDNKQETKIDVDIQQNQLFLSDEFRIRVIFNNILSNAIKYQRKDEPNKYINIICKISEQEAYIEIADNGIGIKKDYLASIYNMFYRATRESNGSGIGLYIVKEAVDRTGGTIEVQSEENVGTKFIIKIPNKLLSNKV